MLDGGDFYFWKYGKNKNTTACPCLSAHYNAFVMRGQHLPPLPNGERTNGIYKGLDPYKLGLGALASKSLFLFFFNLKAKQKLNLIKHLNGNRWKKTRKTHKMLEKL